VILILVSCELNEKIETVSVDITEERADEGIALHGNRIDFEAAIAEDFIPGPALLLEDGKVVFSDLNNVDVYLIDEAEITRIAGFGKGVDELLSIDEIIQTEQGFCVIEISLGQVKIIQFADDGEFISSQTGSEFFSEAYLYKEGIVGTAPLVEEGDIIEYHLKITDEKPYKTMLKSTFQKYEIPVKNIGDISCGTLIAADEENIFITNEILNHFIIYDENGKTVRQVNINDEFFHLEVNFKTQFMRGSMWINNDIFVDTNGFVFIAKWGGGNAEQVGRVDVFSKEGILLDILLLDEIPIHISCTDNMLIASDGERSMTVYQYDYSGLVEKWRNQINAEDVS
jgi:glutaredoxin-related protein